MATAPHAQTAHPSVFNSSYKVSKIGIPGYIKTCREKSHFRSVMPLDWNADAPPPPPGAPPLQRHVPPPGPPSAGAAAFVPSGGANGTGAMSKTATPFVPGTSARAPHSFSSTGTHEVPQALPALPSASVGRATRYAREVSRL